MRFLPEIYESVFTTLSVSVISTPSKDRPNTPQHPIKPTETPHCSDLASPPPSFALIAGLSHAAPGPQDLNPRHRGLGPRPRPRPSPKPPSSTSFAYYCEWVTVYDYWGNRMTVWQCY